MKKTVISLMVAFGLWFWAPQTAGALDQLYLESFQSNGSLTGEILYHFTNNPGVTLPTYCLEKDEIVYVPGGYFADYAIHADRNTPALASGEWLVEQYTPFWHGGYNGNTALDTGIALQFAVWHLDGESTSGLPSSGAIYDMYNDFITQADSHTPAGTWKFGDLTNVDSPFPNDGTDYQGLLVRTSVPEPATLLLLGFGLVGMAGVGRKVKK